MEENIVSARIAAVPFETPTNLLVTSTLGQHDCFSCLLFPLMSWDGNLHRDRHSEAPASLNSDGRPSEQGSCRPGGEQRCVPLHVCEMAQGLQSRLGCEIIACEHIRRVRVVSG